MAVTTLDVRLARHRPVVWLLAGGTALLALAAATTALDGDGGHDALGQLAAVGRGAAGLRWQFAALVVAIGAAHYLAAALAARAASGLRLPLGETVLVQLAASAANRLTPAGLGGSALNVRYFARRGLAVPAGVGAVSALAVLGAAADLLALAVLILVAQGLGLGGVSELAALAARARHLLGPLTAPEVWPVVAAAVLAAVVWRLRRRERRVPGREGFWAPVGRLLRRPRALFTVMAASGATTLLLGMAFVACIAMVPGPHPTASVLALVVGYLVGAAAGSSVPVPAGIGSTEGALVAVLSSLGEPAAHALQVVLIFRAITFWAPAAAGVLATRTLRRRAAL